MVHGVGKSLDRLQCKGV